MGTFDTNEPDLSDFLSGIGSCAIQLPDFQRDWIWDDEHIRSLIASVTLSYPIGAIVTLETGGEGGFLPRPFEGVGFALPVDIHHIFPKAWCRANEYPRGWNSVLNKTPLTSITNRMLGGRAPSKYVASLVDKKHIDQEKLDSVLATHWIEPEFLRDDNYGGFIRDRAIKLLDAIEAAMGKPVQGRDSEEVTETFGGSLLISEPHTVPPAPPASNPGDE